MVLTAGTHSVSHPEPWPWGRGPPKTAIPTPSQSGPGAATQGQVASPGLGKLVGLVFITEEKTGLPGDLLRERNELIPVSPFARVWHGALNKY